MEYEVVWSGGEGLTRVGDQRRGCIVQDAWAGDAAEWADNIAWKRTHSVRAGSDPQQLSHVADRICWYDTAGAPTEYVAQVIRAIFDRRLSRMLTKDRRYAWQHCQLCGEVHPQYSQNNRKNPYRRRICRTAYHSSVCQSCYVNWRAARGKWAGLPALAAWRKLQPPTSPEAARRSRLAAYAQYYQKKKARAAELQAARADVVARMRRALGVTTAPAP